MDFRERLIALRLRAQLSQEQLADACGRGQGWLGNFERGDGFPRVPEIYKLAARLGVHPGELFADLPSQPAGLDNETLAQGVELLHLMADARPEDRRLSRPSWAMIQVAAKAVKKAEGSPREAMADVLAWLAKETPDGTRPRSSEIAGT